MARSTRPSRSRSPPDVAEDEFVARSDDSESESEPPVSNTRTRRDEGSEDAMQRSDEEGVNEKQSTAGADGETARDGLIFTHALEERPVKFAFLGQINSASKQTYTDLIQEHGGQVTNDVEQADTILVPFQIKQKIASRFLGSPQIYVETHDFVNICIRKQQYCHPKKPIQGIGGRPRHDKRVRMPFTGADDEHLAAYLAKVTPCEECGGRDGNKIYEELVEQGRHRPDMSWARRHTMHSWRERFVKRKDIMLPRINEYLKRHPPPEDNNGRYLYGNKRCKKHQNAVEVDPEFEDLRAIDSDIDAEGTEDEEDDVEEVHVVKKASLKRSRPQNVETSISDRRHKRRRVAQRRDVNSATLVEEAVEPPTAGATTTLVDEEHASANTDAPAILSAPPSRGSLPRSIDLPGDAFEPLDIDPLQFPLMEEERTQGSDGPLSAWHGVAPIRRPINSQATLVNPTQARPHEKSNADSDMDDQSVVETDEEAELPIADVPNLLVGARRRKYKVGERVLDDDDAQAEQVLATPAQTTNPATPPHARSKRQAPLASLPGRTTRSRSRSVEPRVATTTSRTRKGKERMVEPIMEEATAEGEDVELAEQEVAPAADGPLVAKVATSDEEAADDDEEQAVLDELVLDENNSDISHASGRAITKGIAARSRKGSKPKSAPAARTERRTDTRKPLSDVQTPAVSKRRTRGAAHIELAPVPEHPPKGTRAYEKKRAQEVAKQAEPFVPSPRAEAAMNQRPSTRARAVRA